MDINQGKFRSQQAGGTYRLTNVHPSFARLFTLLYDEKGHAYAIHDGRGQGVFEDDFRGGIPRYAACLDINCDGHEDILIDVAAFGNRAGTEIYEVLLNDNGHFTELKNPIAIESSAGQANRAGVLTWYSSKSHCATFAGEETDVQGTGSQDDPITVGQIRKIKEVWGLGNGQLRLISKTSIPIQRKEVQYLHFQ